jgi:alanine racemase
MGILSYTTPTNNQNVEPVQEIQTNKCYMSCIPKADRDIVGRIDMTAVQYNINHLKSLSKTNIIPVIKADAYGHGIIEMARNLRLIGIEFLGVATLGEAILLRNSGDTGRIIAWIYDIYGQEMIDAINLDIDIAVIDETTLDYFIGLIPNGKRARITVFVDTGINRAGVRYENSFDTCVKVANTPKMEFVGLMSHLVESEVPNSATTNDQLQKFRDLRNRLQEVNIVPKMTHIANTAACINYDVSDFTHCRPGSGIYGISDVDVFNPDFKLALTVVSYIIQIKTIKAGEGVGYNHLFIAPTDMKICILPIGYADIIPRSSTSKLELWINGIKRKVLGRISMDQIVVEGNDIDKLNDDVIIFGNGYNCPQTIFDVALASSVKPIEILCHAGYRINRTYSWN